MLLHDLTIENFRSFEKYKLDGLARVNLLVGDNNCGKTSVLEAVQLLATGNGIVQIQTARDDRFWQIIVPDGSDASEMSIGLTSLFHGEYMGLQDLGFQMLKRYPRIRIASFDGGDSRNETASSREVEIRFGISPEIDRSRIKNEQEIDYSHILVRTLINQGETRLIYRNVGTHGSHVVCPSTGWTSASRGKHKQVRFFNVPCGDITPSSLISCWSNLIENQLEHIAVEALQSIVSNVSGVIVLPSANLRNQILINRAGRRESLSELGAGTYHVFSIGAAVAFARGGILCIDEIDTGLHYSRLADMWKMVITAAKKLDVQVFATTHSLDCLNGLSDAIRKDDSLAEHVAVHRIERSIDEAVTLTGAEFVEMLALESEIR